jgi:hypothetical protein
VLLEDVDAAEVADRVGDPGADEVRERADGDDGEQRVLALGDVEAGEQERRLGRDRDAGALRHHQQEDPGQPHRLDHIDGELHDGVGQRRDDEHGGPA